jgi:hypothetical protein
MVEPFLLESCCCLVRLLHLKQLQGICTSECYASPSKQKWNTNLVESINSGKKEVELF